MRPASVIPGLWSEMVPDEMPEHQHDSLLDDLVHRADLDELIRLIDARCESRDWEGLERVRRRSRAAVSTGRQLWPAATLAEYRLALLGPAALASQVVSEAVGKVAIGASAIGTGIGGPLTEVLAQTHTWAEIAPHLTDPIARAYVVHERAIRGEEIPAADRRDVGQMVIEIPAQLAPWEPEYRLAIYSDHGAEFPTPPSVAAVEELEIPSGVLQEHDDQVVAVREAFTAVAEPWLSQSNGHAEMVCARGGLAEALGALGVPRARIAPLPTNLALQWLMWAAASGGAHGRRPGAAAGRDALWWLLGTLGELTDQWPPSTEEMQELLADLEWWWWDAAEPVTGWNLRLLCQDASHGVTWAFAAHDAV
jgi:hypothetical protein